MIVSDTRGKGIGVSHHHTTRASPVDDTHAEVSQDSFQQFAVRMAQAVHEQQQMVQQVQHAQHVEDGGGAGRVDVTDRTWT